MEIQKLSDSFEKSADEPEIELVCTIYNINPENNVSLLKSCQVLTQYNHFIEKVREYAILEDNITDAVSKAIEYCIRNHILENFLRERRTEVLHMFIVDGTYERRTELMQMEIDELKEMNNKKDLQLDAQEKQLDAQIKKIDSLSKQIAELKQSLKETKTTIK